MGRVMDLAKIKEILSCHGVIAFPTETVMGLGVNYDDFEAYTKLNIIKRRPSDKPYTLLLADKNDLEKYAFISEKTKRIVTRFMPGPLTILVRVNNHVPGYVHHDTGVIGIRVPNHQICQDILKYNGKPLLVPSANKSGEPPCLTYKEVENVFGNEIDYIVKADSGMQKPSTIIDLSCDNIKLVREGGIPFEELLKEFNK